MGDEKSLCIREIPSYNEQSDELFVVGRYIMERVDSDGNYVPEIFYGPEMGFNDHLPSKTVAFVVHKYDPETRSLRYIDRSLDGLAFFTGPCDGFALSAADFPELKLNSIYFTDVYSPMIAMGGTISASSAMKMLLFLHAIIPVMRGV